MKNITYLLFWDTLNFIYKTALLVGIVAFGITISFYIDFIDVSDLKLENVIKGDLVILSIIILRMTLKKTLRDESKNF